MFQQKTAVFDDASAGNVIGGFLRKIGNIRNPFITQPVNLPEQQGNQRTVRQIGTVQPFRQRKRANHSLAGYPERVDNVQRLYRQQDHAAAVFQFCNPPILRKRIMNGHYMQPHGITFPGNDFIEIIDEIALKTVESVGCGTVVAADDINDFSADWTGAAADDAAARNDFEQAFFAILGYGAFDSRPGGSAFFHHIPDGGQPLADPGCFNAARQVKSCRVETFLPNAVAALHCESSCSLCQSIIIFFRIMSIAVFVRSPYFGTKKFRTA